MSLMIAVPCHEQLDVRFVQSLYNLQAPEDTMIQFVPGSLVYDARNQLAQKAIGFGCDYILWLDSDMVFEGNMLGRMFESIGDKDFLTGLYFERRNQFRPTVFNPCHIEYHEDGSCTPIVERVGKIPDEIFEIEACGFGCVLMKTKPLADIFTEGGLPFSPIFGVGEDISCCIRLHERGVKMWCDPKLLFGHVGQVVIGGESYLEDWNQRQNS